MVWLRTTDTNKAIFCTIDLADIGRTIFRSRDRQRTVKKGSKEGGAGVTSQAGCTAEVISLSALTTNGELTIKGKVLSYLRIPSSPRLRQCRPSSCEEPAPLASFFFASDSVRGSLTRSSASNA